MGDRGHQEKRKPAGWKKPGQRKAEGRAQRDAQATQPVTKPNGSQLRTQKWFCEKCKKSGSVGYRAHEDVMTVVQLIGDDHKKVSPGCDQPTSMIRALK